MGELSELQNTLNRLSEVIELKPFSLYVPARIRRIIEYQRNKLESTIKEHTSTDRVVHHSARVLVCGQKYCGRSSLIERFRACQTAEHASCSLPICKFHGVVVDTQFSLTDEHDEV